MKLFDPEPEAEDDGDDEKGEEETEHVELVGLALIEGVAPTAASRLKKEANTARHRLRGEGSLDDGGTGEDDVHDEKFRGDDDPEELVEQLEIRPSLPHLKIPDYKFTCF